MDPITHAFAGALVADATVRDRLGPRAALYGAAVAASPDLDILFADFAPGAGLWQHRGITQSFFFVLVAAPLLGLLGWRLARYRGDWRRWWLVSALALLSHILLDLTNSYGTLVWLPFSGARATLDALPILDVFVSATLFAAVVAGRVLRRRAARRPAPPPDAPVRWSAARWVAVAAALVLVNYVCAGMAESRFAARKIMDDARAEGFDAVDAVAWPVMFGARVWRVAVRDAAGNLRIAFHSSDAPSGASTFFAYDRDRDPATLRAEASPDGRRFARFTRGWYSTERSADGAEVRLLDRRHGSVARPDLAFFGMAFRASPDGDAPAGRRYRPPELRRGFTLDTLRAEWRAWRDFRRTGILPEPETQSVH